MTALPQGVLGVLLQGLDSFFEHGLLAITGAGAGFGVGDKVRLVPGHCDPTVNLYDWLVGVRRGAVECLWPVTARGAVL